MSKNSHLFLSGILALGLTFSSNKANSQLDREYQEQESEKQQCELNWWPNAQYSHDYISSEKEARILVKDKNVFLISLKGKCHSEFIGYIDSDYNYSPSKVNHFSIKPGNLIEYYKHPQDISVKTRTYTELKRSKSDDKNKRIRRDW